jgi:hypothetical protein
MAGVWHMGCVTSLRPDSGLLPPSKGSLSFHICHMAFLSWFVWGLKKKGRPGMGTHLESQQAGHRRKVRSWRPQSSFPACVQALLGVAGCAAPGKAWLVTKDGADLLAHSTTQRPWNTSHLVPP